MKRLLIGAACALALAVFGVMPSRAAAPPVPAASAALAAAARTSTFAIENMTCALCPVTVKTAMQRVDGVQSVEIDFAAKTATVVFDPARTTVEAIAAASTDAGYPAAVRG